MWCLFYNWFKKNNTVLIHFFFNCVKNNKIKLLNNLFHILELVFKTYYNKTISIFECDSWIMGMRK